MKDFWNWLKETFEEGDPDWWKSPEDKEKELLGNLGKQFGFSPPKISEIDKINRQFNPPRKANPYSWNARNGQSLSHTDEIFMQDVQYHIRDDITNNVDLWCSMPIWGLNQMRQTNPETGDRHPNDDNSGDTIKNIAYIEVMKRKNVMKAFGISDPRWIDGFMNDSSGGNSRDDEYGDPSQDHYDPSDSEQNKEIMSKIPKVKIIIGGSMDQDERSSGKDNQFWNDKHIVFTELPQMSHQQLLQHLQNMPRMSADECAQKIISYCRKRLGA